MEPTKTGGRPRGKPYPFVRSIRLGERDVTRLRQLAEKLGIDQSDVVRMSIREKAEREGLE